MGSDPIVFGIMFILTIVAAFVAITLRIVHNFKIKHKIKKAHDMQPKLEINERRFFGEMMKQQSFIPDKAIHFYSVHFAFDNANKRILLRSREIINGAILNYTDILNYELIENGQTVHSGNTGNAVAGALLFGVAGAVVGSTMHSNTEVCSLMQLRLTINNITHPSLVIALIAPPGAPKNGYFYAEAFEFAKQVIATLDVIRNQNVHPNYLNYNTDYTPKKINNTLFERSIPSFVDGKPLVYHYDEIKIAILKGQEPDLTLINPGDDVRLVQEPENNYDNKAIAVYSNNIKLGYIYRGNLQEMINDFINRIDPVFSCVSTINDAEKFVYILLAFYRHGLG
jgi:hypothetical protein